MAKEHIPFPSIEHFRHVIREVQNKTRWSGFDENGEAIFDRTKPLPTLTFMGTTKVHGTNASVVIDGSEIYFQSRNNIITPEIDNCSFAAWASSIPVKAWRSIYPSDQRVVIYMEWCGQGIQKGVAVSELPKTAIILKIRVGEEWVSAWNCRISEDFNEFQIYKITDFPVFFQTINFNHPELVQNSLKELTETVEAECPVGKAFGVSGTGEGIVWTCVDPGYESSKFMFKVKGSLHSVTKVRTLAAVDIEKVKSLQEFAEKVVTENRCHQGIDYLREQKLSISEKSTGQFLKWLHVDIVKEESDTISASGLEPKNVSQIVAKHGRLWFFDYLNKDV